MSALVLLFVLIGLCLLAGAFFSAAEIAILTAHRAALVRRAREESSPALEHFLERPPLYFVSAQFGNALALVLAAGGATVYSLSRWGDPGPAWAFAVLAPLFLLFGRILPKIYSLPRANQVSPRLLHVLRLWFYLFLPLLGPLLGLVRMIELLAAAGRDNGAFWYTRDELKLILTRAGGRPLLDEEGRQMVDRIFEFTETMVEDVMIPLVEVEALEAAATVEEALIRVSRNIHSRYPLYQERIDNVVGMVETVDLLAAADLSAPVSDWQVEVKYVPYNKPVDELLFDMQRENINFAVVVDEYAGCVGIVTREDIVEEIVGEIEDEHDRPAKLYQRLDQRRVAVNARMEIWDLNQLMGWDLPEGDYETLGGFLLFLFRRVPRTGERIRYRDLIFTIREAGPRAVQEVMVEEAPAGTP